MDAKTGFLLALVDRPAPDPNKMSGRITARGARGDPQGPAPARAVPRDPAALPPGLDVQGAHHHRRAGGGASTSRAPSVHCPGYFRMGRHRWRCDKDSGHGYVDFEHALGASCNVFFYEAGATARRRRDREVGAPRSASACRPASTSPGEVPGVVPDVAWHDAHLQGGYQHGMPVNLAIGQGDVNVTPMQQLVFYGALATGVVWKPQVVLRVEDADGKVLQEFAPRGARPARRSRSRRATRC